MVTTARAERYCGAVTSVAMLTVLNPDRAGLDRAAF
jgi:hypothetical protein